MATELQKNLAREIVANSRRKKPLNKKALLVSVGYATNTAEVKATEILEQKGVQESLEELGFDTDSAKKVVKSILQKGKEENRLKAAQEIFKVQGAYAPEKSIVAHVAVPNDRLKKLAERLNQ